MHIKTALLLKCLLLLALCILLVGHASGQITLTVDMPPGWASPRCGVCPTMRQVKRCKRLAEAYEPWLRLPRRDHEVSVS
ncbi:MAG: hypothetical protein JW878_03225 [Methanomicrobia archaeon]|nr:hypothetical protein [Methanomicrobia archaeon]